MAAPIADLCECISVPESGAALAGAGGGMRFSSKRHQVERPPRPSIASRLAIVSLLSAEDIRAALKVAGCATNATSETLKDTISLLNDFGQAVANSVRQPSIGELRATRGDLQAVQDGCAGTLARLVPSLNLPVGAEASPESLRSLLAANSDPLIVALRDASRAMPGDGGDSLDLAQTLLAVDRLRGWAQAAGEQFEAGIQRETRSRADYLAESPSRALGVAMIHSYTALTGRKAAFSRPSDKPSKPIGPLIRFLDHLFACARARLAQAPAYAGQADHVAWAPEAETFANWIRAFRKSPDREG